MRASNSLPTGLKTMRYCQNSHMISFFRDLWPQYVIKAQTWEERAQSIQPKFPTGPTGKSGSPQKVDQFFRSFSGWTEAIQWVLDRNFRNFWLKFEIEICSSKNHWSHLFQITLTDIELHMTKLTVTLGGWIDKW